MFGRFSGLFGREADAGHRFRARSGRNPVQFPGRDPPSSSSGGQAGARPLPGVPFVHLCGQPERLDPASYFAPTLREVGAPYLSFNSRRFAGSPPSVHLPSALSAKSSFGGQVRGQIPFTSMGPELRTDGLHEIRRDAGFFCVARPVAQCVRDAIDDRASVLLDVKPCAHFEQVLFREAI